MALPTTKTPPNRALERQTILIYGAPKIGKTSFCAKFDRPLFIATEDGMNNVEAYQERVSSWGRFLEVCKELAEYKGDLYKTIIIDVIDNLYDFCSEYVLPLNGMKHGSDNDNKGYMLVNAEMIRVIKKIAMLPFGLVMVSHEKTKTIKTRTGKIEKSAPSLPGKLEGFILGIADITLFFETIETSDAEGKKGEKRVIKTLPSHAYEAGGRIVLKDEIPLDYDAFVAAYQEAITAPKETAPGTGANQLSKLVAASTSIATTSTTKNIKK